MLETFQAWFQRQACVGLSGLPENQRSGRYAYNTLCLLGGLSTIAYAIGYALAGAPLLAIVVLPITLLLFAPQMLLWGRTIGLLVAVTILCVPLIVGLYLAGAASGLHLFIINVIIAVALLQSVQRPVETILFSVAAVIAMGAAYLSFPEPSGHLDVGPHFAPIVHVVALAVIGMQIAGVLFALNDQVAEAEAALAAEHARSEALLQNLLPDEIAARLKNHPGEVIADGLPAVTLLFADIVDFTPRSARMLPEELITWLNRIFSAFDVLTAERGLEKIKTIGDAYMVAAGLPVARPDHAEIIADMALAMRAEVARLSEELGEPIDLRIGIHSGPAIAGVIGTSKVFYDVWGDTVNTASRMESHGEPGRIQVTAATAHLLRETHDFAPRGPIEIKGIGTVETCWLSGRR